MGGTGADEGDDTEGIEGEEQAEEEEQFTQEEAEAAETGAGVEESASFVLASPFVAPTHARFAGFSAEEEEEEEGRLREEADALAAPFFSLAAADFLPEDEDPAARLPLLPFLGIRARPEGNGGGGLRGRAKAPTNFFSFSESFSASLPSGVGAAD